jgi:murein DD-endopeptidase MepM/ murein hydrolase activator NlpD
MRAPPIAAAFAMLLLAWPAQAQTLKSGEIFSSIAVRPISGPDPVLGADGRTHLAYELFVVNPSKLFITLDKVEAVDGAGRNLSALEGGRLAAMSTLYAGDGATLPPGGSGVVFMDVSFAKGETSPPNVLARVTATRQAAGRDGKPAPVPKDLPFPATFTFTGASAPVGKPAVVLSPPLKGRGWVAVNGCCDAVTSHRGAVMSVNGQLKVPERFAIDWVKLDDAGKMFAGDGTKLASYPYYGTPVLAAADGVVVNLYNGADEQTPLSDAKGITTENIGGNMVVVDIGGGAYAFYAHLQRDSLKVKLGDHVKTGQPIGLLGDTGNSSAPHLHFHVMDGPSPLNANGLPFVFTRFSSRGVLAPGSDDAIQKGEAAKIEPKLAGEHRDELPLNNEVVDFD